MKKIFYFTLRMLALLFIFSASQFSVAGQYPVITSVSAIMINSTTAEYHWSAKLAEIVSASETEVYGATHSGAAFRAIYGQLEGPDFIAAMFDNVDAFHSHSIGETMRLAYQADVTEGNFTFRENVENIPGEGNRCLAYVTVPSNSQFWGNVINPAGCVYIPAPTQCRCQLYHSNGCNIPFIH